MIQILKFFHHFISFIIYVSVKISLHFPNDFHASAYIYLKNFWHVSMARPLILLK